MKTARITISHRPLQGLVAFVRSSAIGSIGGCMGAAHQGLPASYPLDRNEGQVHPGEGSA